jgi:tetratricopeptide (TPR) repeat protein
MNWDDRIWDLVDEAAERLQSIAVSADPADLSQFLPEADEATCRAVLTQLIILDQERRWQAGQRPLLETYLEQWPDLQEDSANLADLVRAECQIRASRDDLPTAEELHLRFPAVAAHVDLTAIAQQIASGSTPQPGDTPDDLNYQTPPLGRTRQWFGPREHLDRYEVREVLGQGGMGQVYRAYDTKLQREVAIKTPRYDPSLEPEVAMRFIREIRATAALRHPNICPVYDADMSDGHYFIVMALISGTDLESRLRTSRPEVGETVHIVAKVARALEAAHQAGVVHRDVKPGNILLDDQGEPLLTDFGLCRQVHVDGDKFSPSTLLGTPAYMAPEQAAVQPADRSSDIYSLGVVLYQMLTGSLPFSGTAADVLSQVVANEPPRPRQLRADLDPLLEAVCLRAMHRNAVERYGSAGEFAAALEEYTASLTHPAPLGNRDEPWWIRFAAFAFPLLLIAVAVLAYLGFHERRTPPEGANLPQSPTVAEIPLAPVEPSDRERRIAELRDEIANFANIETDLARVQKLEEDFLAVSKSWFGNNAEVVRAESLRILDRLTGYPLTEQEQDMASQAEALGARTGILDIVERVYTPVRQLAEMLEVRLTLLQNELASLEEDNGTPVDIGHAELPAEFAERIAETQRQIASLQGIDREIQSVWTLMPDFYDAQQELFSPAKANIVRYRSLLYLARLKVFDLTEDEQSLVAQSKRIEAEAGIFSDPAAVFIEVHELADRIHARLQLLRDKLKGLRSWTPDSREFHVLVETLPAEAQMHCDRARLFLSADELTPAIDELNQAIEQFPENPVLLALRAAYQADSDYQAAINDANRAINLDGRLGYAYYVRGYAMAARPPPSRSFGIAQLNASRDHLDQAEADCSTAISLDPKLGAAYRTRAHIRLRLKKYDLAIEDCTMGLAKDPDFTDLYRVRAFVWAEKGDFDRAFADCDAMIAATPHFPLGYGVKGQMFVRQGEYEKAVEAFTEAIRRGPGLEDYYRSRADCYRRSGQESEAEADEWTLQQILSHPSKKQNGPDA